MTSLSRRNHRTTARRTTPLTLAASAAAVLTLCVAPALAQQPGYPAANPQAAGRLPLPPGYRPRTPPPQAQPKQPVLSSASVPGSGGKVMYFQKPADALVATGGPGSSGSAEGAVAQLTEAPRVPPVGVPDVPAASIPLPPPPPESRYLGPNAGDFNSRLAAPPALTLPAATAAQPVQPKPEAQPDVAAQPKITDQDVPPSTSKKATIPPVPESAIGLPSRQTIFGIVYDDPRLEKAIMDRLREDLKKDKKYTENLEHYLVFPPLPVISPPGVAYQPKTLTYPARQAILEPGYVVHRRLHFEERNAERQGWDLGPLQTLVSSAYFFGDVLAWPHSLASGCEYGFWETSAGKCAPGSTTPYYLYPPKLTLSGSAFETLMVLTTAFAFLP